jgi:hypothetical protein
VFASCSMISHLRVVYSHSGAEGRTRTGTRLPSKDFKSFASTISPPRQRMEAAPGLEPGVEVLQTSALPLGYAAPDITTTQRVACFIKSFNSAACIDGTSSTTGSISITRYFC